MPMQKYLISFLLAGLLIAGVALADHGEETGADAVDPAEVVTSADLGVEDPGVLPTSRLYFFKEWGRGLQSFFTFDSVKKAELELRFTNEKAAEAKKVQETNPNNEQAITKALGNYQKSQERLKVRLESLKETSQNPNIDRLLDQVTEKTVKHTKLVEEIALKAKDLTSVQELASRVKERIEDSAASGAAKDDPAKFAARLEKSLVESTGGELKHLRSIALIDRIGEKASAGTKESLEKLREEFSERFEGDLKTMLETKTSEDLSHALAKVPGDAARRSVILEEIRAKSTGKIAESLRESAERIGEDVEGGKNIASKTAEQMKHAREKILELEKKMAEVPSAPDAAQKLLSLAKEHFLRAEKALQEKQFGEAFGQARSAEVAARNGLRFLEESREGQKPEEERKEALGEEIQELSLKIQRYEELVQEKGFTPEQNPEVFKLLENAKTHLGFASDSLAKDDFAGVKLHTEHVKGFLRDLGRFIEHKSEKPREGTKPEQLEGETNLRPGVKSLDILRKVIPQRLTPTDQLKTGE